MNRSHYISALCLVVSGCSAKADGATAAARSPWLAPNAGQPNATSGSSLERFFPLVDGMVYTYTTVNEVGDEGLLIARVHRSDAQHGELRFPAGAKTFELAPDGVLLGARGGEPTYVLKLPLAVGTSWRGEHGGQSRILNAAASVDAPAGHYEGCVQTIEEKLGDKPTRYATTFCPEVGVVQVEVSTGANYERAALKSYAPPMRMRQDGIDRLPSGTPDVPGP